MGNNHLHHILRVSVTCFKRLKDFRSAGALIKTIDYISKYRGIVGIDIKGLKHDMYCMCRTPLTTIYSLCTLLSEIRSYSRLLDLEQNYV